MSEEQGTSSSAGAKPREWTPRKAENASGRKGWALYSTRHGLNGPLYRTKREAAEACEILEREGLPIRGA